MIFCQVLLKMKRKQISLLCGRKTEQGEREGRKERRRWKPQRRIK
jgi:hypothetical protein